MNKLRKSILTVLIICALLFSGCWNYSDVEERFVVMGLAIDYDEEKEQYIMYAEVSRAKGGAEAENITRLESAEGITLFEANRNLITKIGAKVYWGHTSVYIISEKVAKQGISEVIGILSKLTQVRTDIFIMVCETDTVEKVFEFEDPIHENVAQHLQDLMSNAESSGEFRQAPLFKVIQELASDETSLILPYIKMIEIESEEEEKESGDAAGSTGGSGTQSNEKPTEILIADGSAVFNGEKMIGKLSPEESMSALILKEEFNKGYTVTIEEEDTQPNATIEVINSDLSMKSAVYEGEKLYLQIQFEMEADLVEFQSAKDYMKEEVKEELEKGFEEKMQKDFAEVIMKNRDEYNADVFSFAGCIHRQQKKYWKTNGRYWDDIYKEMIIDICVDVNIKSSALTYKTVKVGR